MQYERDATMKLAYSRWWQQLRNPSVSMCNNWKASLKQIKLPAHN